MYAVRLRRQDQAMRYGRSQWEWGAPYPFPTFEAAMLFAIRSVYMDGWDAELEDGSVMSRTDKEEVVGKPLKPLKKTKRLQRPLPEFYRVPEGTAWSADATHLVTTMADGLQVAWDLCGECHNSVFFCTCSRGITATNAVMHIAHKTAGVVAGMKWDDVPPPKPAEIPARTTFVHPWRERKRGKPLKPLSTSVPPLPVKKPLLREQPAKPLKSLKPLTRDLSMRHVDDAAANVAASLNKALKKRLAK